MSTTLIEVRPAKAADATAVASTHDEAWRSAYQGIIPGGELEKLINRLFSAFAGQGKVKAQVAGRPLEEVNAVLDQLRAGKVDGRIALTL